MVPTVTSVRVMVVDDMTLVREGIHILMTGRDSVEIIGKASDVQEATGLMAQTDPDVDLLDQDLPGLDTSEAIFLLKQQRPQVEVIVLSETPDEERALRALEAGASGYVLKDISPENLVRAIHGVRDGRTMTNPYITRQLIERFRVLMRERGSAQGGHPAGLSARELEIVVEMARGHGPRDCQEGMPWRVHGQEPHPVDSPEVRRPQPHARGRLFPSQRHHAIAMEGRMLEPEVLRPQIAKPLYAPLAVSVHARMCQGARLQRV